MSREYRTSSAVIGRLVEQLSARGVSFDEIKERVGLSELRPDDPDFSISMTSLLVLWEFAIERTGDPALALKLPRLSSTRTTHFVAQIAVNSRNLREAMQLWAQYAPLISDSDRIELREDGDHAVMIYRNVSPDHQNIWMPEYYAALSQALVRQYAGHLPRPIEIHVSFPDPGYAGEYRRELNAARVVFNSTENMLIQPREYLEHHWQGQNQYLGNVLRKYADAALEREEPADTFEAAVREIVMKDLTAGSFSLEGVARRLFVEPRTLHRRLQTEGTSYREIVEDVRRRLAVAYLKKNVRVNEISHLLGYSEPSAFQRAFQRWFGCSPGAYRRDAADQERD